MKKVFFLIILATVVHQGFSQKKATTDSLKKANSAPVIIRKDTLFQISEKLGPYTPLERAGNTEAKIEQLIDDRTYEEANLVISLGNQSHEIKYVDMIVHSVTLLDAQSAEIPMDSLANVHRSAISDAITKARGKLTILNGLKRAGLLVFTLVAFYFLLKYLNKGFSYVIGKVTSGSDKFLRGIKIKNYEFVSAEREVQIFIWLTNLFKWFLIILAVYLFLPIVFSIFPATEKIAETLIGYILNPLKEIGNSFLNFIPSLIRIIILIALARYVLKMIAFLSREIESGKLVVPGFYSDWARPTYNILRFLVIMITFIMVYSYIPGSDSDAFKGVSVFVGLLISLGASSAIGNAIAGLVITYMRPFKVGERVKIGSVTGDILEKTMLVTRMRTIKNEDVTIPNAAILSGHTVNYSSSAKELGLILHTGVTIGYDVPWRQVHELLLSAAAKTSSLMAEPKPFVLQTSLDDFYVAYQLNAYTEHANKAAGIYSELHGHIQDAFNEAGVEILSPHYRAARDGNMVTLPPDYVPKDYVKPGFNIEK